MLTIEKLRAYGADVDEGLARCMGMEDFYIGLVVKALADNRLPLLERQIGEGDLDAAFETAHALKGMYANLSLTPLIKPVSELTELLRSRTATDYSVLLADAKLQFDTLRDL
ncbi:MAG: Hpt domain-containing protein [Ruminococcus sp.]|nr:Hpt domain-containing protein [Ruminococcus sp.]MBP3271296.1 Hpt domain-containing protein [Ruminococcus sp.]